MRRVLVVACLVCLAMVCAGCYSTPAKPPIGAVFSDIQAPLTTELHGQPTASRRGEASTESILGLVSWGDCSLEEAARDGGLTTIQYCDYAYQNVILGIYQKFTVIAYGD